MALVRIAISARALNETTDYQKGVRDEARRAGILRVVRLIQDESSYHVIVVGEVNPCFNEDKEWP